MLFFLIILISQLFDLSFDIRQRLFCSAFHISERLIYSFCVSSRFTAGFRLAVAFVEIMLKLGKTAVYVGSPGGKFLSGLPGLRKVLHNRIPLMIWGMLMGMLYSGIMDIWTVLWADGAFNISRYLAAVLSAAPFTAIYAVSNTVFLLLFARPIGKILDRLKTKYAL